METEDGPKRYACAMRWVSEADIQVCIVHWDVLERI